jgi:uncharacterized protein (TIGR02145 family)
MRHFLLACFLLGSFIAEAQDTTSCADQPGTEFDHDGDMIVGIADVLQILQWFGTSFDTDQDGIMDCEDDCVGSYDECGVCNGPGPQVLAIDTIIITYDSIYVEAIDDWLTYELTTDTLYALVCDESSGTDSEICADDNSAVLTILNNSLCAPDLIVNGIEVASNLGILTTTDFEFDAGVLCIELELPFISLCYGLETTVEVACGDSVFIGFNGINPIDDGIGCPFMECGDLVSMDGYDYSTVQIGDQCWFAENLRTTVYANGDTIAANLSDAVWIETLNGGTAVFGEGDSECDDYSPTVNACDEAMSLNEFGRLYNWWAVADDRGICPLGWHVPSDEEWQTLELSIGMPESALDSVGSRGEVLELGRRLVSSTGWYQGQDGLNEFGFDGRPGGYRIHSLGKFYASGASMDMWSGTSSQNDDSTAWMRYVTFLDNGLSRSSSEKNQGFSVRCLRDAD